MVSVTKPSITAGVCCTIKAYKLDPQILRRIEPLVSEFVFGVLSFPVELPPPAGARVSRVRFLIFLDLSPKPVSLIP